MKTGDFIKAVVDLQITLLMFVTSIVNNEGDTGRGRRVMLG